MPFLENCNQNGFSIEKMVLMKRLDDVFVYILPKIDNYYMHIDWMRRERENSFGFFLSSFSSHDRSSIKKKEKEQDL
jgi:hypothetical protein